VHSVNLCSIDVHESETFQFPNSVHGIQCRNVWLSIRHVQLFVDISVVKSSLEIVHFWFYD